MTIFFTLVITLQILAALTMIGLVLIQHGKGADMGASFGSGASGSLFGATGSANFLSRSTAVCAGIFFACTLALAYVSHSRPRDAAAGGTTSVLDRPAASAPAAAVPAVSASLPAIGAPLPAVAPPPSTGGASGAGAIPTR